jgi:CopG family nickel-responsive transcriptional regulator
MHENAARPAPRDKVVRTSFSVEKPLLEAFEKLARGRGAANRSEFFRDLVREKLVEKEWKEDRECLGTITILYDHTKRTLSEKLVKLQHGHFHSILASTHVHLDHDLCAEAILIRDRASRIREMADLLGRQKGVLHAALSLGSLGRHIP